MENVINLNNNCYIKVISKNDEVSLEFINITNFKIIDILKEKEILHLRLVVAIISNIKF